MSEGCGDHRTASKPTVLIDGRVFDQIRKTRGTSLGRLAELLHVSPSALRGYLRESAAGKPSSVNESTYLGLVDRLRGLGFDPSTLRWTDERSDQLLSVADLVPNFESSSEGIRRHFSVTAGFLAYLQERTKHFVGRDFVFERIDAFLAGRPCGYFVITGEPGIGKTTIVARLVETRKYVFHFNSEVMNTTSTDCFLQHVCAQVITRYGLPYDELPSDISRDGSFFAALIEQAARRVSSASPLVIVIDALDEWDGGDVPITANPLFLPPVLPERVFVIVTTKEPIDSLRLTAAQSPGHLELRHDSDGNVADARKFVEMRLSEPKVAEWMQQQGYAKEELTKVVLERSEHNFMYLHHVLSAIAEGDLKGFELRDLPTGLQAYYGFHWRKMKQDVERFEEDYKPIVCVLASVSRMLTVEEIAQLTKLPYDRVAGVLSEWRKRSYVRQEEGEDGEHRFQIYHTPFKEFLAQDVDRNLREHRRKIATVLYKKKLKGLDSNSEAE